MANSDKNILITPHVGGVTQPNIVFTGQGNDPITVRVLDGATGTGLTAGGALSFEGSAGQLFSIVNRLGTGSIFSVNDISGIPSIDVDASGRIVFAGFMGNVGIGATLPSQKLDVGGNIRVSGGATFGGTVNMGTNLIRDLELRDYYETVATPSFSSGVLTCDLNSGQVFNHTVSASITKIILQNVPNKASTSVGFTLVLKQGSTGGYTAAFSGISGATAMFSGGTPPTLTSTANKTDIVSYVSYDQGLNWFGFVGGQNY